MFCPQCTAEYRPGFTRCSDCDIPLVDYLPREVAKPRGDPDSSYVAVASVAEQMEADQICSFLEANGIPAEVPAEVHRRGYGVQVEGIASLQIYVPRELATTARDLLTTADRGDLTIDAADE